MSDQTLSPAQRDDLRALAGMIIPASAEFDVPGADDPKIQADIVATLGRDAEPVRAALDLVARLAAAPLAALDEARREAVAEALRATGGAAFGETSMRSSPAASARRNASSRGSTPRLAPSSPMTRSSGARIA